MKEKDFEDWEDHELLLGSFERDKSFDDDDDEDEIARFLRQTNDEDDED